MERYVVELECMDEPVRVAVAQLRPFQTLYTFLKNIVEFSGENDPEMSSDSHKRPRSGSLSDDRPPKRTQGTDGQSESTEEATKTSQEVVKMHVPNVASATLKQMLRFQEFMQHNPSGEQIVTFFSGEAGTFIKRLLAASDYLDYSELYEALTDYLAHVASTEGEMGIRSKLQLKEPITESQRQSIEEETSFCRFVTKCVG
jgi:hypothetical protein